MRNKLGVRLLTNYTYKEQQLIEEVVNCCTYKDQSIDWYKKVDINSVNITSQYEAVGSDADVYNDNEEFDDDTRRKHHQENPTQWYNNADSNAVEFNDCFNENGEFIVDNDEATAIVNNLTSVNWLEDPYKYRMYDGARAQMDGGAKCTVTNKLELLHDVRFYNRRFKPNKQMKGATLENVIVPVAEGYLKVPTILDDIYIKIKCYYSPEFTSTLLSDCDVLDSLPMKKEYDIQSMIKFFERAEIDELPEE